jgi:hypothetical protein
MSSEAEPESEFELDPAVAARVRGPGSLLIGIGLANMLGGLLLLQSGLRTSRMAPAQFREEQREGAERLVRMGWMSEEGSKQLLAIPADEQQATIVRGFYVWSGLSLVGSFLTIYGGYNLRSLNSYGLAVAGAVIAAIPCTSPIACAGIGVLAGVWAFSVLMRREVRAAFL